MRIPITDRPRTTADANGGRTHHSSATAAPNPRPADDEDTPTVEPDVPDPTVDEPQETPEHATPPEPVVDDPTVPPANAPVDHAGASGASGGTPDAAEALEENMRAREEEQDMWERQSAGEVETQTKDTKPTAADPEQGLPANPESNTTDDGPADATTARAASEHDERFLRLAADFENYKRQAARREKEARERATRSVLEDLLPVLDNFERALQHAQSATDVESLKVGVGYILQQLRETLKSHGVEPIQAQGKPFDPLHHEALEEVEDSGHPEGTVVDEAQRGYSFRGQVLRPSRVRVASGKK